MSRMLEALKRLAETPPQDRPVRSEPVAIQPRRVSPELPPPSLPRREPLRLEIPDLALPARSATAEVPRAGVGLDPQSPEIGGAASDTTFRGTLPIKDLMQQLDELDELTQEADVTDVSAQENMPPQGAPILPSPSAVPPWEAAQPPGAPSAPVEKPRVLEPPRPFQLPPPRIHAAPFERDLLCRIALPSCHEPLADIASQMRGLLEVAREQTLGLAALAAGFGHAPLAYALAKLLADHGEQVLLVDGGVGLSALSRALDYGTLPGWVDAINATDALPWIVPTASAGLWFLPSGRGEPLGQAEALHGWRRTLDQLRPHFSLVLVDLGGIVESLLPTAGRLCDAVFLSAPLGVASLAVQMRLAQLRRSGIRLRGCVGLELDPE